MDYERCILASLNETRGYQAMYGYLYISPDNEDTPTGAIFYYNFHADEARCVWMVPASEYPPL